MSQNDNTKRPRSLSELLSNADSIEVKYLKAVAADIIDHTIEFYVKVTGNGTNPAIAYITNASIALCTAIPN